MEKNQEIIDKHLKEFYDVQKTKVPIELNSYLHKMIDEVNTINKNVAEDDLIKMSDYVFTDEDLKSFETISWGAYEINLIRAYLDAVEKRGANLIEIEPDFSNGVPCVNFNAVKK
jgi:aspartate carbamoyltransferase regulatory subunit